MCRLHPAAAKSTAAVSLGQGGVMCWPKPLQHLTGLGGDLDGEWLCGSVAAILPQPLFFGCLCQCGELDDELEHLARIPRRILGKPLDQIGGLFLSLGHERGEDSTLSSAPSTKVLHLFTKSSASWLSLFHVVDHFLGLVHLAYQLRNLLLGLNKRDLAGIFDAPTERSIEEVDHRVATTLIRSHILICQNIEKTRLAIQTFLLQERNDTVNGDAFLGCE